MDIANHLQALEKTLLTSEVRKDPSSAGPLLADEFRDYGSSGNIYSKAEVLDALQKEAPLQLSLIGFEVSLLTQVVALVTYRAVKQVPGAPSSESLRSSLWVLRDERWQILFHQGTTIPPVSI